MYVYNNKVNFKPSMKQDTTTTATKFARGKRCSTRCRCRRELLVVCTCLANSDCTRASRHRQGLFQCFMWHVDDGGGSQWWRRDN